MDELRVEERERERGREEGRIRTGKEGEAKEMRK